MRDEIEKYCRDDVAVLRQVCTKYRNKLLELCSVDPFHVAATNAKLTLDVFLRRFLDGGDVLAIVPEHGYIPRQNQSKDGLRYVLYYADLHNLPLRTCLSAGGEFRIPGTKYRADGYASRPGQRDLIVEYYGCYYHGCPTCFPQRDRLLARHMTADKLYQETVHRERELDRLGYALHTKWECELKRELAVNPWMKTAFYDLEVPEPLSPRKDALSGGRTEPFAFAADTRDGHRIHYNDFTSLYSFVMRVGHPDVIGPEELSQRYVMSWSQWNDADPCMSFKGLMKLRVLPPKNLEPAFVPFRTKDKRLVFGLCAACASEDNQDECGHSDRERSWTTALTHFDVAKALQLGYTVINASELWSWQTDRWRGGANGIFTRFINTFVKMKTEAKPAVDVNDPVALAAYIAAFREREGIELDPANICDNPVGKLCQKNDYPETHVFSTLEELCAHLSDSSLTHYNVHCPSDVKCMVESKRSEDFAREGRYSNVVLPMFVTAYGRMHLYEYMKQVIACGGQLLYCDTDSVIYRLPPGAAEPSCPNIGYLGDMMREHAGDEIIYAAQLLNYEAMKTIVLNTFCEDNDDDDAEDPLLDIDIEYQPILRTNLSTVYATTTLKKYRAWYRKGRILRNILRTEPYGFLAAAPARDVNVPASSADSTQQSSGGASTQSSGMWDSSVFAPHIVQHFG